METRMVKASVKMLLLTVLISLLLTACGGVSENDIKESIENKKAGETAKLINSYQKQDDKEELDEAVENDFEELCESTDYSDYLYMDKVISKLKDKELKARLEKVVHENGTNKVLSFIEGDWVRRDYTDLDGVIITVKNNKDDSVAIIDDAKKSKNKNFQKGDVKWKNIKAISSDEFVYEDLIKGDDISDYNQAYATIDYEKNQVVCKVTSEKKKYSKGNTQVWIKKDAIDENKEIIGEGDFAVNGEKVKPVEGGAYYTYATNDVNDKKLKEEVKKEDDGKEIILRDKISVGESNRNEVISAYGYGSIIYRSYKQNAIYTTIKDDKDVVAKGFVNIMKQSKYSVVYSNKTKKQHIELFFNSGDKLIGVSFGDFAYSEFI